MPPVATVPTTTGAAVSHRRLLGGADRAASRDVLFGQMPYSRHATTVLRESEVSVEPCGGGGPATAWRMVPVSAGPIAPAFGPARGGLHEGHLVPQLQGRGWQDNTHREHRR